MRAQRDETAFAGALAVGVPRGGLRTCSVDSFSRKTPSSVSYQRVLMMVIDYGTHRAVSQRYSGVAGFTYIVKRHHVAVGLAIHGSIPAAFAVNAAAPGKL